MKITEQRNITEQQQQLLSTLEMERLKPTTPETSRYDPSDPWYHTHNWWELRDPSEVSPDLKNVDDAKSWWEREGQYRFEDDRIRREKLYYTLVKRDKTTAQSFADRLMKSRPIIQLRNYAKYQDRLHGMLFQAMEHEVAVTGSTFRHTKDTDIIASSVLDWMIRKPKPGILLMGLKGIGKTIMLRSIVDVINEIDNIYTPYVRSQDFDKEWAKQHIKDELVAIDDIGREQRIVKNFGNETSPMADYISKRHSLRLGIIATTNITPEEAREAYGDATSDRFNEMFVIVRYPTNITSYRKETSC